MSLLGKLRLVHRMMADPEVDRLYKALKEYGPDLLADPAMHWWRREAAFLHAHGLDAAMQNGMKVGGGARVEPCVIFMGHDKIEIGRSFVCSFGATVRAVDQKIGIGDRVSVGPFAAIVGANHGMAAGEAIQDQPHRSAPVTIGDDAWIGTGAIVLPGSAIGAGAVVAAGSVVTGEVEPGIVVAGAPARPVGERS